MSDVKPKAGEWYEYDGEDRVWCIGCNFDGLPVMQYQFGAMFDVPVSDLGLLKHLPSCTGWDWVEETFPQYWTSTSKNMEGVFHKQTAVDKAVIVLHNGKELPWEYPFRVESGMKQITEQEALALLDKPADVKPPRKRVEDLLGHIHMLSEGDVTWVASQLRNLANRICPPMPAEPQPPADSPNDWVEITDPEHVLRRGIDHIERGRGYGWEVVDGWHNAKLGSKHGAVARCRRSNLPKPAPAKRNISVPMWLITSKRNGRKMVRIQDDVPSSAADVYTIEPAGFLEVEVG